METIALFLVLFLACKPIREALSVVPKIRKKDSGESLSIPNMVRRKTLTSRYTKDSCWVKQLTGTPTSNPADLQPSNTPTHASQVVQKISLLCFCFKIDLLDFFLISKVVLVFGGHQPVSHWTHTKILVQPRTWADRCTSAAQFFTPNERTRKTDPHIPRYSEWVQLWPYFRATVNRLQWDSEARKHSQLNSNPYYRLRWAIPSSGEF